MFAHSIGINNLSPDVCEVLELDVEYRICEIMQVILKVSQILRFYHVARS